MKRAISLDSIVIAAKDQASCELSGESVILNLKNGVYYGLDRVGSRIWNLIQAPTMVAFIRDSLLAEYEVDSERCEADLLALLQKLADQELVQVVDEKAA
jgi:coenzyme PQQ synthesis protein D (PqqD)